MIAILAVSYDNPGDISPGVLGFIVVAGMAVVLFLLFRSMSKHLRRVASARDEGRELGEPPGSGSAPPDAGGADDPAGTGVSSGAASKKPDGAAGG